MHDEMNSDIICLREGDAMGLLGFVAGTIVKEVAKDVASITAVDAAYKVMPRDDEGTSVMDLTNVDPNSKVDKAIYGTGQIIHDTIHPNKPEDYIGGIPDVTVHDWQSDNSVQHLPTNTVSNTIPEPVTVESQKLPDTVMTLPEMSSDSSSIEDSTLDNNTNEPVVLPTFTSHF